MFNIIKLAFNLFIEEFFFEFLLVNNFEKRLFASIQIIKQMIKIEKIKIYW